MQRRRVRHALVTTVLGAAMLMGIGVPAEATQVPRNTSAERSVESQALVMGERCSIRCTITSAAAPGLCLDADLNHIWENGARVQLWSCSGQGNQMWQARSFGRGKYELRNMHSFKCLEIDLRQINVNGAPAQQWDCLGLYQTNQHWIYYSGSSTWTGFFLNEKSRKVLDADANCVCVGGKVQQWDKRQSNPRNQQWILTDV